MKKKTHLNPFLQTFRNASLKSIKEQNNFFWHFVNVLIQDEQCKVRMYSNLKKKNLSWNRLGYYESAIFLSNTIPNAYLKCM